MAAPGRERPSLLSLSLYYISAGLPTPEWAQKPRHRVTHDKCPGVSPTGPAWPCHSICPTAPQRVLAGVSFGHRALKRRQLSKKRAVVPVSPQVTGSPDLGEERTQNASVNEPQVAFWGWKRYWEKPDSHFHLNPYTPPPNPSPAPVLACRTCLRIALSSFW